MLNFSSFIRGFSFSLQMRAFFLLDRIRKLQFVRIGAMIFSQGFIFGSTVRSIGVPPDLNLYTL